MAFWRNMFKTAAEVSMLQQQLAFSEAERGKLEWKVSQLEKEVVSERKRFDKTQSAVMDFAMQKSGITPKVAKAQADLFEDTKETETKFTPSEESTIEALAKNMMAADIESGIKPYSLEAYKDAIKKDPARYQSILIN